MDQLSKWIYRIRERIPKKVKEDYYALINNTSIAGLYLLAGLSIALFVGYLIKGCGERNEKPESKLETEIESISIIN